MTTVQSANGAGYGGDLAVTAAHQHMWRPDAIGSVCFLAASALTWFENAPFLDTEQ